MDYERHSFELTEIYNRCTSDEYYPLGLFYNRDYTGQILKCVDFEDITILYGGNGSGKTTLLNVMVEKLKANRYKKYLKTEGFACYVKNCRHEYDEKPDIKKFLSSDDIFDHIFSVRNENKEVKRHKSEEMKFYENAVQKGYRHFYPNGARLDFEDAKVQKEIDKINRFAEAQRKSKKQFVRSRAGEMQRLFSNGENALIFFDREIERNAVYFLDEPENSMSPKFQLDLKMLIEDSVKYKNCQFVVATHSPFLLSMLGAKVYNLDTVPVTVERWYNLENVRAYYDFFKKNEKFFT